MSKTKQYFEDQVEQEVDIIKDQLVNNQLTLEEGAEKLSKITGLGLITDITDYDEMAYMLKSEG